jgi:hypothetical protein
MENYNVELCCVRKEYDIGGNKESWYVNEFGDLLDTASAGGNCGTKEINECCVCADNLGFCGRDNEWGD